MALRLRRAYIYSVRYLAPKAFLRRLRSKDYNRGKLKLWHIEFITPLGQVLIDTDIAVASDMIYYSYPTIRDKLMAGFRYWTEIITFWIYRRQLNLSWR